MRCNVFLLIALSVLAVAFAKDELKESVVKTAKSVEESVEKDDVVSKAEDAVSDAAEKVKEGVKKGVEAVKEGAAKIKDEASKLMDAATTKEKSEEKEDHDATAEDEVAAASINAKGLTCYQCNSGTAGQELCGSSDEGELSSFLKACVPIKDGTFKGAEANGCRKIIQNVREDEPRTIRECSFTGEPELDGKKRSGNKGISMYYYQCQNEGEKPCNSAVSQFAGAFFVLITAFFVSF